MYTELKELEEREKKNIFQIFDVKFNKVKGNEEQRTVQNYYHEKGYPPLYK